MMGEYQENIIDYMTQLQKTINLLNISEFNNYFEELKYKYIQLYINDPNIFDEFCINNIQHLTQINYFYNNYNNQESDLYENTITSISIFIINMNQFIDEYH